jgi:hypothetical protein
MKLGLIITLAILGISVLLSYYIILGKIDSNSYFTHPLWFGINSDITKMLSIFQIFAAIGFIIGVVAWFKTPPSTGIMSNEYVLFTTICLFFISSIVWTVSVYYKVEWLVILSLIITAICSILLLAGSVEDIHAKWYIVLGFMLLCITTVLGDGVLWNANYIKRLLNNSYNTLE